MNKVNTWNSAEARLARAREDAKEFRDRQDHARERAIDRLRLEMTSLGQQFTGMFFICTFISSIMVALISLANNIATAGSGSNMLTYGQLMWYLALVYSLTTAIASGASAVFAFAQANGSREGDVQKGMDADKMRMRRLVRGFGVFIGVAVTLLFGGLLVFIWAAHDRWITVMVGMSVLPLWGWLIFQLCGRWEGGTQGWRLWAAIPWSSWSISRWRRTDKEEELDLV